MRLGLRRWVYSPRRVWLKLSSLAQNACKLFLRATVQVCESDTARYTCLLVTFAILFCSLFVWLYVRDPCFQWEIRHNLCEDYSRGLVAGSLCYDLCVEKAVSLSNCVQEQQDVVTFFSNSLIYKVQRFQQKLFGSTNAHWQDNPQAVWEGMSHDDLSRLLHSFFRDRLGDVDHTRLVQRVMEFSDFNMDGKLSYGEVNSIWQLLQIHEFHILFIFQGYAVFPVLNSTCGRLYSYERVENPMLYDNSKYSVWDKLIRHRYRWGLPEWPKRVHISLGLLDYAAASLEENNVRFFMCDLNPKNFGFTHYYESKVTTVEGVMAETQLQRILTQRKCVSDSDCIYGKLCSSNCDRTVNQCSGNVSHSDLVGVCKILTEYLLYDTPIRIKWDLTHLIAKCNRLSDSAGQRNTTQMVVQQNIILSDLSETLWKQLKDEQNPWLQKETKKPRI